MRLLYGLILLNFGFGAQVWAQCQMNVNSPIGLACRGDANAALTATATGTQPFSFTWSTGQIGSVATGLAAGTYTVTLSDGAGCTTTTQATVTEPASQVQVTAMPVSNYNGQQISCAWASDGALASQASGGTAPYVYLWSSGHTTNMMNGLPAGVYSITVVDANGCQGQSTATLTPPMPVQAQIQPAVNGTATAFAQGGTANYTYVWNVGGNVQTTQTASLTGHLAGTPYCVTVTDMNGCMASACDSLNGGAALPCAAAIQAQAPSTCAAFDGGLSVVGLDSQTQYNFAWNMGATTSSVTGLGVGCYSLTISDAQNTCRRNYYYCVQAPSCYVTITGRVLTDLNANCQADSSRVPSYALVQAQNRLGQSYYQSIDNQGNYRMVLPLDSSYSLSLVQYSAGMAVLCPTSAYQVLGQQSGVQTGFDFYLETRPWQDLALSGWLSVMRPGFSNSVSLSYGNLGLDTVSGASITCRYDSLLMQARLDTTNWAQRGLQLLQFDSVQHSFSVGLPPVAPYWSSGYFYNYLIFNAYLAPSVPLGTPIHFECSLAPLLSDSVPSNNAFHYTVLTRGSFDPNDKQATARVMPNTERLDYRIRFQNTGTDTAFTVEIRDTLSATDFNPAQHLQLLESSHEVKMSMKSLANGDYELIFHFENILLPDSNTNEAASHGYVWFSLALQPRNCAENYENTASIYFDFNAPVVTNTMQTEVYCQVSVERVAQAEGLGIEVYPNPSNQGWQLKGLNNNVLQFKMFDNLGRLVQQGTCNAHAYLQAADLPAGLYRLVLSEETGKQQVITLQKY